MPERPADSVRSSSSERRVTVSLPTSAACAGEARSIVTGLLQRYGQDDAVDVATLLTSEIVTNAFMHAGTAVDLCAELTEQVLRVQAIDRSTQPPRIRSGALDSTGGRGLLLVERLATDWGWTVDQGGKVVWFELQLERPDPGDPRSASG